MQGKKIYQEKLFNNFRLSDRVPEHNFYRRLKSAISLGFLYPLTKGFYGSSGQKSIDPVVFFKLCLVGYLENIVSDRKLMDHCSMRLDILFFLDYDIDDELPWHSTISRTRQLFPEQVFEEVFTKVFELCVSKGMVSGHTQAIDSAPVKANASMDSLELKVPEEELESHLRSVRHISKRDKEKPLRQSKGNKAGQDQQTISASKKDLQDITGRNRKWSKEQNQRPGAGNKGARYYKEYAPKDVLFEGQNGGQYSTSSFNKLLKAACKRAEINKKVTAHTLRHSYATHLLEKGIDIRVIQKLLGHNSIKTTMLYTQVAEPTLLGVKSPFDD